MFSPAEIPSKMDPFDETIEQEVQTSVSITGTDFVLEPHNSPQSNCDGGFDHLADGSKTFYHDAVNSMWQHKWIDLDKDTSD